MSKTKPKSILITGAAQRIGRLLALTCADAGFGVVAHFHKSREGVIALGKEVRERGVPFHALSCDLSVAPKGLINRTLKFPITLAGLINNASSFEKGNLLSDSTATRKLWQINTFSPLSLMRDFSDVANQGFIINMLDANIQSFHPDFQAYRLSKRMLKEFTLEMAALLAPTIRVNAIAPGAVLPSKFLGPGKAKTPESPMHNGGTLEDVRIALLYLLESSNITGQILYTDGGIHLKNDKG